MKKELRVLWCPQVGACDFMRISVDSVEEAAKIMEVLADYDMFQYDNNIKPDYCNMGFLEEKDEDGEWVSWYGFIDDEEFEDPVLYVEALKTKENL